MTAHVPIRAEMPHWPRLMDCQLAARYVGISATYLREHGPEPKRLGKRVLYDIRDLDRWADTLDGQPLEPEDKAKEGDDMARRIRERYNGKH